jgi:hypothetical protein
VHVEIARCIDDELKGRFAHADVPHRKRNTAAAAVRQRRTPARLALEDLEHVGAAGG